MAVALNLIEAGYSRVIKSLPSSKPEPIRVKGDTLGDTFRVAEVGRFTFLYERATLRPSLATLKDIAEAVYSDLQFPRAISQRKIEDHEFQQTFEGPLRSAIVRLVWYLGLSPEKLTDEQKEVKGFVKKIREDPITGSLAARGDEGLRQLLLFGQREVSLVEALDAVGITPVMQGQYYTVLRPGINQNKREVKTPHQCSPKQIQLTEAWEDRAKDLIYKHLHRLLGNASEVSDLASEVYLKAFENIDKTTENLKLIPWLYRIASNLAIDVLRRRNIIHIDPLDKAPNAFLEPSSQNYGDPVENALSGETIIKVRSVMEKIAPKYRTVLALFYYKELSVQEIGDIFGISQNAAKSLLHRARENFKDVLSKMETQR